MGLALGRAACRGQAITFDAEERARAKGGVGSRGEEGVDMSQGQRAGTLQEVCGE